MILEWDSETQKNEEKVKISNEKDIQIKASNNFVEVFFKGTKLNRNGSPDFGKGNKFGEYGYDCDIEEEESESDQGDISLIKLVNQYHTLSRKTAYNLGELF